jgi:hypothetical protein
MDHYNKIVLPKYLKNIFRRYYLKLFLSLDFFLDIN